MRDADDSPIWRYALENEAIIVTKDEDFPHRSQQTTRRPGIVWLRIGKCSRKALLQWFEPFLPQIELLIEQGNVLIELL